MDRTIEDFPDPIPPTIPTTGGDVSFGRGKCPIEKQTEDEGREFEMKLADANRNDFVMGAANHP